MLWDPGLVKDGVEEEGPDSIQVTPILVPLQNKPTTFEKGVPVLVPDVQELKDQFQQQQSMLTQIKETLKQNESQLSSKGKQVEVYANKLSQIRARSKNTQGKKAGASQSSSSKTLTKKPSKENLAKIDNPEDNKASENNSKIGRKGKMSELKKCLEENKIKFEQRTGKEQSETKKIESLVEQLKTQLEERDKTIQDLHKNIEHPMPKPEGPFPRKAKQKSDRESVVTKMTQTNRLQPSEDSIEVTTLRNKIYELEENLKEKESVIEARTQAVTLLSQDLSLKGKNTLENLEETRQEMRAMQNNFIAIEDNLKKDLVDRDNRLAVLEEKCKKLESTNFDLSLRNSEQQEKLVNLQEKYLLMEAERKESSTTEELTKKISLLTKELDDRNKSMIKMKIEHKKKIRSLSKTLENLKGMSDDKAEIIRLGNLLEEFEHVKIGLENRVVELEDEKATEKKLKGEINELEVLIKKQNEDLTLHLKTIANLEKDNLELIQTTQEQSAKIETLSSRIESMETEHERKMEALKEEHCKDIEVLEEHYRAKGESVERKELEEYRISTEMNNIHVEEQIELLVREKQQLLEKLKSLSGVSSTDSLTFEKMEHSDLGDDREAIPQLREEVDLSAGGNGGRSAHLQRILNDQQILINELQKTVAEEKEKPSKYQQKITELEGTIKHLEDVNVTLKLQVEASEGNPSQKSNLNAKNRFKKIQMDLSQSRKTIQEQKEKLEELNEKLEEKENLIKKYTEKMEGFEKDDWDRQNHWKNTEDDIDSVQELQKKCLSLENNLIEVSEDCERLRKENIEVVHLLSEEKVNRKKLLEQMQSVPEGVEKRINSLYEVVRGLEEKVVALELSHSGELEQVEELEGKLEWANVVLTSKETEIFRLQNLLEDRSKSAEILEGDLVECKVKLEEKEKKLEQMTAELKAKEVQLEDISGNFDKLQECVDVANQKTATNEVQLKELLATVKEMEADVFRKESELQEIKGILAEKNLDMTNLRNRLEEVNSDLTYSYQEHLENMGKCLRDKESDFEQLLAEKNHLEDVNRSLVSEKEDIYNQKVELVKEKEKLEKALAEKESLMVELKGTEKAEIETKSQEMEDLKIKMKKLAANLKKKAQNEADLVKQVKELEGLVAEKERAMEEVREKWETEKGEKEKIRSDLSQVLASKVALEEETKVLKEKHLDLEKKLEEFRFFHENQVRETEGQVQTLRESYIGLEMTHLQDKGTVADLETRLSKLFQLYQNAESAAKENQHEMEEERKAKENLLQKLAEATGKLEEITLMHEQLLLEKCNLKERLEGAEEKVGLNAKIQENFAVIETLEVELNKTRDQMKMVEQKFFQSEERRMSLENKNEEMSKKMAEDSETLVTIDYLSLRVDELLKSEKFLQDCVQALESGNSELKQALDEMQSEKYSLEAELKASGEKVAKAGRELKRLRELEAEKSNAERELTKEVERLRRENKQLALDFEKLNLDYEQFEVDFKENLDNFQKVDKSLKHRIEELTNENSALMEKCNLAAAEEKNHDLEEEEKKKPKKRKSVTFRTDEVEYIKELKNQLHNYDGSLKQANEEIENLRSELFREKLRNEVSKVVADAQEKVESLRSSPEVKELEIVKTEEKNVSGAERKFDASVFFGKEPPEAKSFFDQSPTEPDSLMWDDGWGTDGHLEEEYLSGKVTEAKTSSDADPELKKLHEENERLAKESQDYATKYSKALKKLKELKAGNEKLQSEISKIRSSSDLGNLDATIVEELKFQIQTMEIREKELVKSLENAKTEKESLLKKMDVLNAGNEKFMEMKERQNNEAELWQRRNDELLREISNLRQELAEPQVADEDSLTREVRELRNKVEVLEWKNCELNELLEEKQELLEGKSNAALADVEKVMEEKFLLEKEVKKLKSSKEKLEEEEKERSLRMEELKEERAALATENETLQDILGGMKEAAKKEESKSKIFDYFKTSGDEDLFPAGKESEAEGLRKRVLEMERLLRMKDEERKRETEAFRARVSELEGFVKVKEEEVEKGESFRRKLADLEKALEERDETLREHRNSSFERRGEIEALRQRLAEVESERGNEIGMLRQSVFELETFVRVKDEELQKVKESREKEVKNLSEGLNRFETIDLNERPEEAEILRQRIFELEGLLSRSDEERNEEENLRQRVFHLEEILRLREEELGSLQAMNWSGKGTEQEDLSQKLRDTEELVRVKESEVFQIQAAKANLDQKVFELENLAKFKEEEFRGVGSEVESLRQRIVDLESLIHGKDEEISRMTMRLHELEKSYNDSKLEIERLLNEEKLNTEEKFVEPFQKNIQIPVPFELEALSRTLHEEKQKSENLKYELSEKEKVLQGKNEEIQILNARLAKEESERKAAEGSFQANARLEKVITKLEQELESCNLQLNVTRRELEELQNVKDGAMSNLKSQLFELESELLESREKFAMEIRELKEVLTEKEILLEMKAGEEVEEMKRLMNSRVDLEKQVEASRAELERKENDVAGLAQALQDAGAQVAQLSEHLMVREAEVADLRQTLIHLQSEITQFRNFEKQVKELRGAKMEESAADASALEDHPAELGTDRSEHELGQLSTRLQSDLDTALYMLHQRDVRCDELTFELMQLLEERDTLQLRLSTALRINEEFRSVSSKTKKSSSSQAPQENKDLVDQAHDREAEKSEDLRQLASKISELHSVSYLRDKRVKDDSVQRHQEQMNLLSRISDSDISLSRDVQSSPAVLLNWVRGKTTPKVMHI